MAILEILRLGLLTVHFLGMAALIGTFLLQLRRSTASGLRLMLAGAGVQVLSGNALIASNRLQGMDVIETKMVAKLVLATLTLALLIVAAVVRRRREYQSAVQQNLQRSAGGLGVAALLLAAVWT